MRAVFSSFSTAFAFLAMGAPTIALTQDGGGSLRDFRLPPAPAERTSQPAQGPVAPDIPSSREVLRPSAPAPSAQPTPGPAPSIVLPPVANPTPDDRPSPTAEPRSAPAAPATPAPRDSRAGAAPVAPAPELPASPSAVSSAPAASPVAPPPARPLPDSSPSSAAEEQESGSSLLWLLAALLVLAGLALGGWAWRRRQQPDGATTRVPQLERRRLTPSMPAAPAPASPAADGESLQLELEPLRLSLTLMNATLAYRLELTNRGAEPLEALSIGADMIAAHASVPREQQLSGPDANAMQLASIARLEPGESRIIAGEARLPLGRITPIRQGPAALLLPLARFRLESAGRPPLIRTFLVAQPPERPGAGLQPFRLDQGPRIYPRLARRAFA